MVAAIKDYKMILIMPENLSQERRDAMAAYGAELILVSETAGMEGARDLARARRIVTLKLKQNNIRRIRVKTL
jgi:cysteine synthase